MRTVHFLGLNLVSEKEKNIHYLFYLL
uniref:Uncharacterized protein n=1 Tax=Heterorhabditis bacteriophora TaxID=37862 RepID=A0A1I7WNR2_HETBA